MTDKPDRQDGDGPTGIEAAKIVAEYIRVRAGDVDEDDAANIIHILHEAGVRFALPTRDGAEGAGAGARLPLNDVRSALVNAVPIATPATAMREALLDAQEGLRGLLAWTGATRNGVLSSEDRVAFEDDLKIALKARATVDRALSAPVPPASGPVTTEQLDQLQFGRSLHERPVPPADGAPIGDMTNAQLAMALRNNLSLVGSRNNLRDLMAAAAARMSA